MERLSFFMKDLKCESVVVYSDRAEVTRLLTTKLKKGENELIIKPIADSVDQDSFRIEGHGDAIVLDVVCKSKRVVEELSSNFKDNSNQKLKDLKLVLVDLESKLDFNRQKYQRIEKQFNLLNSFASSLSKSDQKDKNQVLVNDLMSFIDIYGQSLDKLDVEKLHAQKEAKELENEIKIKREILEKLSANKDFHEER
jgi:hypothetical protein